MSDAAVEGKRLRDAVVELSSSEGLRLHVRSSPRKQGLRDSISDSVPSSIDRTSDELAILVDAIRDSRAAMSSLVALRAQGRAEVGEAKEQLATAREELELGRRSIADALKGGMQANADKSTALREAQAQARRAERLQREVDGL